MVFKYLKKRMAVQRNQHIIAGVFFLILQAFLFYLNYQATRFDILFWFCNHTPLILGIAFLLKKTDLIKAIVNVGFLAQFFWTIDFISKLFFDVYIFKVTRYVFEDINGIYVLIPILVHVLGTNLAFYMTHHRKPKLITLLYSLIYLTLLFAITINYTPFELNVNCTQKICGLTQYTFENYTYYWPVLMFFAIVLPTQGIQYLAYRWHKKRGKKSEFIVQGS